MPEVSRASRSLPHPAREGVSQRAAVGQPVRILGIPGRLDASMVPSGAVQVSEREWPELVVLTEPQAERLLARRIPPGLVPIIPVVETSDRAASAEGIKDSRADMRIAEPAREALDEAIAALIPMVLRMRSLPRALVSTDDPRLALLARLFVRGRGLPARRDPNTRETIAYPDHVAIPGIQKHAESLVTLGLLRRKFFDTVISCPRCESGRVVARERCLGCRSTNLSEEPILHHLRCAYQAGEHEFRTAGRLTCPKCRAHLEYFGVDYNRPGSLYLCSDCGSGASETSVGFVCLDCELDSDSEDMGSYSAYTYDISSAGLECLRAGAIIPRVMDYKKSAGDRVRSFIGRQNAAGETYCILRIKVEDASRRPSRGRLRQVSEFLFSLMQETFTPETEIINLAPQFLLLLANDNKSDVERGLADIRQPLERHLAPGFELTYDVWGPDELRQLLEASAQSSAAHGVNA